MSLDLNLRHLHALAAVLRSGSVSGGAAAVGLSQPALTQGIRKLEQQFGHPLFERRRDGVVPTPVGTMAVDRTEAALGELVAGNRHIRGTLAHPERRVSLPQLRAFVALENTGSFLKAAALLAISQTAAHRAVHELEGAVGRQLVERRGRGVFLNAAGRRFARAVRLALSEIDAISAELGLAPEGALISLGTMPLARAFLVPEAMASCISDPPPVRFKVTEGSWAELIEKLRDGVVDLIVGESFPAGASDLLYTPLSIEPLLVVAGRQHPLAGVEQPTLDQLAAYPWIVDSVNSPLREEWERLFAGRRPPDAPVECGSVMIIGRLLTTANFLTVLTPDLAGLQIRSGLLTRIGQPLAGSQSPIGVTARASWRPTAPHKRFVQTLVDIARTHSAPAPGASLLDEHWLRASAEE